MIIAELFPDDLSVRLPDGKRKLCLLEFFCRSRRDARQRLALLRSTVKGGIASSRVKICPVCRRNWAESWKENFKVRRISRRVVVKPAWKEYRAAISDCVIEVDPGLSFGTGEHFTTQSCLKLIDERQAILRWGSFFDAGCGSGILSVAAAKLGFKPVMAIDNDPLAVRAARGNFERNEVAGKIVCRCGDLLAFKPSRKYSVVAANLFSNVLIRSAEKLAGLLEKKADACLILSGILESQYAGVAAEFRRVGLLETKTIRGRGWRTAVFEWNPARTVDCLAR